MTKTSQKKSAKVVKSQTNLCPILQKIEAVSEEEKLQHRYEKQLKIRVKRKAAKERRRQSIVDAMNSSNEKEVIIFVKKQAPPSPKVQNPTRRMLDIPHTFDSSKGKLWYSAKELKPLYPWLDSAPAIAPQAKSLGGQCGYQAQYNLMNSIDSIATNPNPKQRRYFNAIQFITKMSNAMQLAL